LESLLELKGHVLVVGDLGTGKTTFVKWIVSNPPKGRTVVVFDLFGEYRNYVEYHGVVKLNPLELPKPSLIQALDLMAKALGERIPLEYLHLLKFSKASSISELLEEVLARASSLSYRNALRGGRFASFLELLEDRVFNCSTPIPSAGATIGVELSEVSPSIVPAYSILLYFKLLDLGNAAVVLDNVELYIPRGLIPLLASLAKSRGVPVVFTTDVDSIARSLIPKVEAVLVFPTTSTTVISLLSMLMDRSRREVVEELDSDRPLLISKGRRFRVERLSVGRPRERPSRRLPEC